MLVCQFCSSECPTKNALRLHQRDTQYCLVLQGKECKFKCPVCNKGFTRKKRFEDHKKICIPPTDLKEEVDKLRQELEKVKAQLMRSKTKNSRLREKIKKLSQPIILN